MLAVSVEFLHGTFRGDPDGTANTGGLTRGEWPPAPARLFSAFVAADGTRDACRVTDGSELNWLEALPAPEIYAEEAPTTRSLEPRFVVRHTGKFAVNATTRQLDVHQEYVGRKGAEVRPGVRISLRDPRVVYKWEDASAPDRVLKSLRLRAARIGYLGAADSPVRVRVWEKPPVDSTPRDRFFPDDEGDHVICVPRSGDLELLDGWFDQWTERGASVGRGQFPALRHEVRYRAPSSQVSDQGGRVVAWLSIRPAVSGRRVRELTARFKDSVLSRYEALYGEPPAVLTGHGFESPGYEIARYLALPDVGFPRSGGQIHGLALWTPPGWDPRLARRAGDAARAIWRIQGATVDVRVQPYDRLDPRVASSPRRWLQRANGWATAFPAIHERRKTLDLDELRRWCAHAGLPAPSHFRTHRKPLIRGAVDLAPVEVNRPGRPGLPYSHLEIWFPEPVRGPVVVGSGRQRGFGLCVPILDSSTPSAGSKP